MVVFFGSYVKVLRIATALLLLSLAMASPARAAGEITGFTIMGACKASSTCGASVGFCKAENVTLYAGDRIVLCLDPQEGFDTLNVEKVSLIINGQVLSKNHPALMKAAVEPDGKDAMEFVIPSSSEKSWQSTLRTRSIADQKKASTSSSDPKSEKNTPQQENREIFYKNVEVGLALNGRPASVSKIGFSVNFSVYDRAFFLVIVLATVLPFVGVVLLARYTNALRDRGLQPLCNTERPPYSMARCQAAFWFLIVFASYVFLALITNKYAGIINSTALTLMGIGSGTALGAVMIDVGSLSEEEKSAVEPLLQQQVSLTEAIDSASLQRRQRTSISPPSNGQATVMNSEVSNLPLPSSTATLDVSISNNKKRLKELEGEISSIAPKIGPRVGQVFYKDLLTDKDGISFHRFQMLCWTLVMGVIFICSVFSDFLMPTFDGTQLALIGISAGTYLGFKFPEKHV